MRAAVCNRRPRKEVRKARKAEEEAVVSIAPAAIGVACTPAGTEKPQLPHYLAPLAQRQLLRLRVP